MANSVLWASGKPTPEPTEVLGAKKALVKLKAESEKAKEAWDKSKLETTLWDQRYKRAYQQWAKSKGPARPEALLKRQQAEEDLKQALEIRRSNWYRSELASMRARSAADALKILEMEQELRLVEERIKTMKEKKKITPVGSPTATGK